MMRKTKNTMLTKATFFQFVLILSSKPALQARQLKHRTLGSFPHNLQSGLGEVVALFLSHTIGLTYLKSQSFEGLQQPDCTLEETKLEGDVEH